METKSEKVNDAVKMMREIRDNISKETGDMNFKEFKTYMNKERLKSKYSNSGKEKI